MRTKHCTSSRLKIVQEFIQGKCIVRATKYRDKAEKEAVLDAMRSTKSYLEHLRACRLRHVHSLTCKQPREAKAELWEGLRALDHKEQKRLPPSNILTALKRMGIELSMKPREAEGALRVFQVRVTRGWVGVDTSLQTSTVW